MNELANKLEIAKETVEKRIPFSEEKGFINHRAKKGFIINFKTTTFGGGHV